MAKRGNGEGSITHRRDGRWMGQITVGHDPKTGRLKRRTFYGKTRREISDKLANAITELQNGRFAQATTLTVAEWISAWLDRYAQTKRTSTWENYESLARVHIVPALGAKKLRDLRPEHLQLFYNELLRTGAVRREGGLAPTTVRQVHAVIHEVLEQAVREELVGRNVSDFVSPPTAPHFEIQPPSVEHTARLLKVARGHRLYALFLLYLGSGMRRGEALALRWQDVDLSHGTIAVHRTLVRTNTKGLVFHEPKTRLSWRVIPIPDLVRQALVAHCARQAEEKFLVGEAYEDQDLVFATPIGHPIDPGNANRTFDLLLKAAGLRHYRLHDLRHAFATRLLELGEHPKVVQVLLGHSSIAQTLNTYSHVSPGLTERAVQRLNDVLQDADSRPRDSAGGKESRNA